MTAEELERRLNTLYEQARSFVEHEDELVHQRMQWMLATSAFLFAGYGATWIAWPDVINDRPQLSVYVLSVVRVVVCVLGGVASMFSLQSIVAAHHAIRGVNRKYSNIIQANSTSILAHDLQVWKLIGDRSTHIPGFYSSAYLPLGITITWSVAGLMDVLLIIYYTAEREPTWVLQLVLGGIAIVILFVMMAARIWFEVENQKRRMEYSSSLSWELTQDELIGPPSPLTIISEMSFRREIAISERQIK